MIWAIIVILSFGALCIAYWLSIPILKKLPQPTGPFLIGTKTFHWIDTERDDAYSPNIFRELMVQMWYPADAVLGKPLNYAQEKLPAIVAELSRQLKKGSPWMWRMLLNNIKTHTYTNAALSHSVQQYPIILLSPGALFGVRDVYMVFVEELASHGFIVVAIDHPYGVLLTQFPDGRIVTVPESLKKLAHNALTPHELLLRKQETMVWVKDISFVIDQLIFLNNNTESFFYQRLDIDNIGMIGQSLGGSITLEACRVESRLKCGVNMDGWLPGVNEVKPLNKPCMFLVREDGAEPELHELCRITPGCVLYQIPHTYHRSFSDYILAKRPINMLMSDKAHKKPYVTIARINKLLVSFFKEHLKNR